VSCAASTVSTGKTLQCTPTVTGTGNYSSAVNWAVNGTAGGSTTYGSVSTSGLYQAPTTAPAAYVVTLSAISSADSTKSGSASVLIAGTIASATQPIVASAGGTISLPGGASVTIPANTLTANTTATLQLSSISTQPTNSLFSGAGPSLALSLSPAVGEVGAAVSRQLSTSSTTPKTSSITFVLPGGQNLNAAQLQNALGVLDVNDGSNNYFAVPTSYNASQSQTTIQIDPTMIEPSSSLQVGLTFTQANSLNHSDNPWLQVWDVNSTPSFTDAPANYCPPGSRTLVMVHGMLSSVTGTFGQTGGSAMCSSKSTAALNASCPKGLYDNVIGVEYQWWKDIDTSAKSIGKLISSLFDGCTSYNGTFDIEAHSEGTIVSLQSIGSMTASTQSKLKHIVLAAGPIDGTPVAQAASDLLTVTYYLNLQPEETALESVLMPASHGDMTAFIEELTPYSTYVLDAQAAAQLNVPYAETIALGGDNPHPALYWESTWFNNHLFLQGMPNDGIIPVSSSLPTDSVLPNLVRLFCAPNQECAIAYPFNHVNLVNNGSVMPDVLNALNGSGATQQVTLSASPQTYTMLPDQSVTLMGSTANILNPHIQWSLVGGAVNGTLNSSTGRTVQYTAPQSAGGPFLISASVPAITPAGSTQALTSSASISVVNPAPTITAPVVPASLAVDATPQSLTINGLGFVPSSAVTFNGVNHSATFVNASQLTINLSALDLATVGTFPVVVTNPGPGGGSATASFTVLPLVIISPSPVSVPAGSMQTFTATVSGGGTVTWSVEEGASGGSITSTGIYTAPTQTGAYHVVATNAADASETATATVNVVAGPSIKTLHSFNHTKEGAIPWSAPIFGSDGNLYGTTEAGGDLSCTYISTLAGCGTIYKSDTSGNVTPLHSFDGQNGAYPVASLLQLSSSTFDGTTDYGGSNTSQCIVPGTSTQSGCGSIFSFDLTNGFSSVYSFGPFNSPSGAGPTGALTQNSAKTTLYGSTEVGGNSSCTGELGTQSESGCGSIFTISGSSTVAALHTFSGSEGAFPASAPIQLSDGNLYGVTSGGGNLTCSSYASPGCGTVYQMTSSGSVKTLHSFNLQDGAHPYPSLILASDGDLYSVTIFGGSTTCSGGAQWRGCGTIFKIDTTGNFTSLHSFSGPDGAYPTSLIQGTDGYFYGTTQGGGDASCSGRYGPGCGTVFKMDSAGNVTVLYSFTGQSDGSWPESGVIQGTDGNLYGTTAYGGTNDDGVIFRISNLTALAAAKARFAAPEVTREPIAPLLMKQPHVGPPGPPAPAQQ